MMIKVDYPLHNSAKEQKWVDVKVDRKQKTVDIIWRLAFSNGGIDGSNTKLSPISYSDLVNIAKDAVEFYWSRNGSRGGGIGDDINTVLGKYKVNVKAEVNTEPSMSSFKMIESLDNDFGRSTSLAGFRKVIHNLGYYYSEYQMGQNYDYNQAADSGFKLDSAHEVGHIVLNKYSSGSTPDYSWTHKGTSTEYSQTPLAGFPMPASGEIDIMKYSDKEQPESIKYARSVAASEDVAGLMWLSRVNFND